MVVAQPGSFGDELRGRRTAAGLSLPGLAKRVHYSAGYLSKIENGHKRPTAALARLCDAALDAGGVLAALVPSISQARAGTDDPATTDARGGGWTLSLAADGSGAFLPFDVRELPGGAAADAATLTGIGFPAGGAAVADAEQALHYFRAQFDQLRRLGQNVSPSVVLPILVVHTQLLRAIGGSESTAPRSRRELLALAARYAEFTGWMAQEAGDDRAAAWWTATAVRLAAAGGDHGLTEFALVRRADLALYRHDAADTVELARRAQADPATPARVRGLAAQHEAQGHALAGDHDACLAALDRAGALLAEVDLDAEADGPVLGSTNMPDPVALALGWCLYEIGHSDRAARILEEQVAAMPVTAHRARALWGARCALAHAAAGELDRACELTDTVLAVAAAIDSATVRSQLRALSRTLGRSRSHPPVRDLLPRITKALHRPSS